MKYSLLLTCLMVLLFANCKKDSLQPPSFIPPVDPSTVVQEFSYRYDGLRWDARSKMFSVLNLVYPNLTSPYPLLGTWSLHDRDSAVCICRGDDSCWYVDDWQKLPYLPFDSIGQTKSLIFYSIVPDETGDITLGYSRIYAKPESGIDFSQTISVGIFPLH